MPPRDMPADSPSNSFETQWQTILVADVVGSVQLFQLAHNDFAQRWMSVVRRVRDELLIRHGGRLVKHSGDGMMLIFSSAAEAVSLALRLHQEIERVNEGVGEALRIQLRAGISCGEVTLTELDVFGADVNQAVLLSRVAQAGQTAVSASVRDRLVIGLDADYEDLGDCYLRDTPLPVRTFIVSPTSTAVPHPPRLRLGDLRPALAVVPFDTFDLGGLQTMLGDVLADEVIGVLSRNASLTVISRLSTAAFRGRAQALDSIQSHLQVQHVLGGRVHVDGDRMRVLLQLVDVKTSAVIWSGSHVGSARGVFGGSDPLVPQIAREVSDALATHCVERARQEPLVTLESYCLLMAAVGLLHGFSRNDFDRAGKILEELIHRDRRHPTPHAWMAKWHVLKVQQGWGERERDSRLALDHAQRALDLDPSSSLTLAIAGFVQCNLLKDFERARASYEQALAANPNESLAWLFQGTLLAFQDEGEQAMVSSQRALELSPLDPMRYFYESLSATAALSAGQWGLAIERATHSLRLNYSHTSTLRVLTIANVQIGAMDEARRWAKRLLKQEEELTIAEYRLRSPSTGFKTGEIWCESLRAAGVPAA